MEKTYATKARDIERSWFIADADGQTLGRLATRVAMILRGKHKPSFSQYLDTGDFVVIVNAEKVAVSGTKLDDKNYYRHSGYPGGLRTVNLRHMLERNPERALTLAVRGMLPSNKLGRKMLKKLKVYAGAEHPHSAQQPQTLEL